ncbi:unnamed protein product [Rotaria socialis]|uniref:NADH dehydrogenase [ubiquinone] 1 beta subcomplex subunit 4 n=1 Tax=Rotaria socialis TaxID=392032 RepID=A0A820F980_9BILA|nr:unnamed protein product [Rotaria socialis]CAF4511744.1 unnamed protein product [Rotaria socialis]
MHVHTVPSEWNLTSDEIKLIQKRAQLRVVTKAEFLKRYRNPFYASVPGHFVDPQNVRLYAYQQNSYRYLYSSPRILLTPALFLLADGLLQYFAQKNRFQDPIIPVEKSQILHGGLTVFTAAIFITGEMAGTGLLALPKAMDQAGWYGLISTFVLCVLSGYSGIKLGDCWTMLREMNPVYSEEGSRSPFQVIATEGAGRVGNQTGVVFLLLAAQNLQSLFDSIHAHLPVCVWIIIVACLLLGPCWLGTPKDSWPIAIGAMVCTAIACVFITISTLIHYRTIKHNDPSPITFKSFSFSMGTMFFAWGGSAMFPTIQVDMRQPHRFHLAVIIAYSILLVFYLPVSVIGYLVYGSHVQDNILKNLPRNFLRYSVEILITGHLAMAFTIVLNPIFQGFEELTRVPKHFCWQRAILRSGIVLFLAFMAESIPHFGAILAFIGSSTVSILGFILPVICFVMIKVQSTQLVHEKFVDTIFRVVPKLDIILLALALFVGLYGALASSYSSFSDLVNPKSYVKPCWLNSTAAEEPPMNASLF